MQVNAAKPGGPLKEGHAVIGEYLRDGIAVPLLARKIETGHNAGVLIQARSFGESAQRAFNRAHSRVKFLIGQTLFVNAGKCKQATVAPAFQGEDARADEARNRNDAAC